MAPRKRTSPKKSQKRRAPALLSAVATASGRFILAHPRGVFGASSFFVVFSIIAANALWYQPSHHPSPMFRTRDDANPYAVIGYRNAERIAPEGNVTTFSFQRPDEAVEPSAAPVAAAADVKRVQDIQKELAKRGLYSGAVNGVPSQDLNAAILAFQEGAGMEQTGLVSDDLLIALMVDSASIVAAIPKERPMDDAQAQGGIDPIAAAIREAQVPQPKQAPKPAAQQAPTNTAANTIGSELPSEVIAQIQQGLVNSSYVQVTVDGVAGPKTREAIRSFEKHYSLPETGVPNQLVLKKLKAIGAFNRPGL